MKQNFSPVRAGLILVIAGTCAIALAHVSAHPRTTDSPNSAKEVVYDREPTYQELAAFAREAEEVPQSDGNVVEGAPDKLNSEHENADWAHDMSYVSARALDANTIGSDTDFFVCVDRTLMRTCVFFRDEDKDWNLSAAFDCGVGKDNKDIPGATGDSAESHTFTGTFKLDHKYERCGGLQWFSVYVPCWGDDGYEDGQGFHNLYLGYQGRYSNGCVRLTDVNAKWIYDNVDVGSTVYVF